MAFVDGTFCLCEIINTLRHVYGRKKSWFRKGIKMKIILYFTIIYPKINRKVVNTILPWQ